MKEKFLEEAVTKYVDELAKEGSKLFDDLYDEGIQFINIYIKDYLNKYRIKYQTIKTLLRGNTPVYLYDVYFPLKLKTEKKIIETQNINNLFKVSNCVTIIGDAGSGKSTLVKHLFLDSISSKNGIPILIELRYFNSNNEPFEEYLKNEIFNNNLVVNDEILKRYLENGKFIFFLDGFDELNQEIVQKTIRELIVFINKFNKNRFILTTRPYSNVEMLSNFHNLYVCELKDAEVKDFIRIQLKDEVEVAEKIINSVKEYKNNEYIKSFLANPLLLTLYILTYQSNPSVPEQRYIFYRRVFNALFSEHDSKTKFGFTREKVSNLTQEQFEAVLKKFCFLSYFEGKFIFDREYACNIFNKIKDKPNHFQFDNYKLVSDLMLSVALWTEDGGNLSFAHRSLQEYFTALFITSLSEENKNNIYAKINTSLRENRYNELKNLMSLCREMDEIDFYKYLQIPILKEIENKFDVPENDLLKTFVQFLFNGFWINSKSSLNQHPLPSRANPYALGAMNAINEEKIRENGMYLEDLLRQEGGRALSNHLNSNNIDIPLENTETKNRSKKEADFLDIDVSDIMVSYFDHPDVWERAKSFKLYLSDRIKELEEFVKNEEKSDEELLKMI